MPFKGFVRSDVAKTSAQFSLYFLLLWNDHLDGVMLFTERAVQELQHVASTRATKSTFGSSNYRGIESTT